MYIYIYIYIYTYICINDPISFIYVLYLHIFGVEVPGLGAETAAAERPGLGGWQLPTGGAELSGCAAPGRRLAASQA